MSTNTNPEGEVVSRRRGCDLENRYYLKVFVTPPQIANLDEV